MIRPRTSTAEPGSRPAPRPPACRCPRPPAPSGRPAASTSSATTAKPRPTSPARAASTCALSARIRLCWLIAVSSRTMSEIASLAVRRAAIRSSTARASATAPAATSAARPVLVEISAIAARSSSSEVAASWEVPATSRLARVSTPACRAAASSPAPPWLGRWTTGPPEVLCGPAGGPGRVGAAVEGVGRGPGRPVLGAPVTRRGRPHTGSGSPAAASRCARVSA